MLERLLALVVLLFGGLVLLDVELGRGWATSVPGDGLALQRSSGAQWSTPAPDEAPPASPAPTGERGNAEPSEEQPSSNDALDALETDVEAHGSGTPRLPNRGPRRLSVAPGDVPGGRTPATGVFRPPRV